jgi:ABC-type uncharacterized transport system substrate-binding protein
MLHSGHMVSPLFWASLLLISLCAPARVSAHPHVWVTVETEVVFNARNAITGFRHKWTFDEAYSRFAVEGRDLNNDGVYDRDELKELADVNVESLKEFEYFTFPRVANTLMDRDPPNAYWLEFHDGLLTLFFTLPLKTPIPAVKVKDFTFAVYDPTFYVDFEFAKDNPVRLSAAPAHCKPVIKTPDATKIKQNSQALSAAAAGQVDPSQSIAEEYAASVHISCPAT